MKKTFFVLSIIVVAVWPCRQNNVIAANSSDESTVEIRFAPPHYVYVHADWCNSLTERPYYDCILHTISVVNASKKPFQIDSVKIEALKAGRMIQCRVLHDKEIRSVSKPLLEQFKGDFQPFINLILWTNKVVPQSIQLTSETNVKPKSALIIFNTYLSFSVLPDELRISAIGRASDGKKLQAEGLLKVVQYKNKVKHSLPLEGSWFMRGMPANGVLDHHRFGIPNEYGVDFCRMSPTGELFKNEGKEASDYYGLGEKVLASADGTVVAINNSAIQKWTRFNPAEGESPQEFQKRQFEAMKDALRGSVHDWVGGNYVIIKHAEGEYSSYFHLREKSVRVKVGDNVQKGQHIGDVGNTGDSFEVHLHFQLNDSPDFASGRSLPFSFENIQTQFREPGRFVRSEK